MAEIEVNKELLKAIESAANDATSHQWYMNPLPGPSKGLTTYEIGTGEHFDPDGDEFSIAMVYEEEDAKYIARMTPAVAMALVKKIREQSTYELVGRYVEAEREYALLYQRKKQVDELLEGGEDAWHSPKDLERMAELEGWMQEARPKLPGWYDPDFLANLATELSAAFEVNAERLNAVIRERRESGQDFSVPTFLSGQQRAYEWARVNLYQLWELVAYRGKRKPVQAWKWEQKANNE
jgi:hypothetical protein